MELCVYGVGMWYVCCVDCVLDLVGSGVGMVRQRRMFRIDMVSGLCTEAGRMVYG